ncbi:molybdopterin-dependent oxidoreductase [Jannaschia sp.]|nr:molybdopterin-dependent oxidoreductase [Jannaschia sp.]
MIPRILAPLFAALLVAAAPAGAQTLLTVTKGDDVVTYDRAALEALPTVTFETSTIWTEDTAAYTGVPLLALLADLGVEEGTLRAQAVNDYTVDIPVSDAVEGGPILAYDRDGAPMSLRDKGPLWVLYPYDANEAYRSETIYGRSIWQLDRIEVAR